MNPNNTFVQIGEDLIGSGDRNGTFATKHMKIAGKMSGSKDVIASQLDLKTNEFNEIVRRTGRVIGFAPGHVEMPGAFAVQIELKDGSSPIIYMQNDGKAKTELAAISRMNGAIISGKNYTHTITRNEYNEKMSEMVVTELNPQSKTYEAAVIRSATEYSKDEISKMEFKLFTTAMGNQVLAGIDNSGNKIIPVVVKLSYDQEMQRGINRVTDMYDKSPDAKQPLGKNQKNQ